MVEGGGNDGKGDNNNNMYWGWRLGDIFLIGIWNVFW